MSDTSRRLCSITSRTYGDTELVFLEMFGKVDRFQDMSFSEWLAHTPAEAVMAHLNIDKVTFDAIPKNGGVVMPL